MIICSSTHLYHYFLSGDGALDAIQERGLLPLSASPESPRWQQLQEFYRGLQPDRGACPEAPLRKLGRVPDAD